MAKMMHSRSRSSSRAKLVEVLFLLLLSVILKKENQLWAWIPSRSSITTTTGSICTGITKYPYSASCSSLTRVPLRDNQISLKLMANPSPSNSNDEAAKAMTDYLAKSHEEKLKTLALLREKDNYIQKLMKELESFKAGALTTISSSPTTSTASSSPVVSSSSSSSSSAATTEEKLTAYQRFIANYVVKAQEEKYRAIQRAEAAMEKKYQDKLQLLLQKSPTSTTAVDTMPVWNGITTTTSTSTTVAAAAAADTSTTTPTPTTTRVNIGAAIVAKGQDSPIVASATTAHDNNILLSATTATTSIPPSSHTNVFFQMRTTKLLNMAKEGSLTRWGEAEIQKLQKQMLLTSPTSSQQQPVSTQTSNMLIAPTTMTTTPTPTTTISLQERLKFGVNLQPILPPSLTRTSANGSSTLESLYNSRTVKVLESANAGKTRWGDAEIQKLSNVPPTTTTTTATTTTTNLENNDNLYHMRTTKIIESAHAGKSRWGDAEIQKISSSTKAMDSTTSVFQNLTSTFLTRNNHVINVGAVLLSSYLLLDLSTAWASY